MLHLHFFPPPALLLGSAYDRLITGVTQVGKDIPFSRDERLGFLNFSPENLGNAISVSIQMKLPKLSQMKAKVDEFEGKFDMKVVKLVEKDVYEVSSKMRLSTTEFQTVNDFANGILALVDAENSL